MTEASRSADAVAVAGSDSASARAAVSLARRLPQAAERFVAGHREGTVVASALIGFLVLWTLYHSVASAPLDADPDLSDVSLWAGNFGSGYHHPPLQTWLFGIWFAVFPHAVWAVKLLVASLVTISLAITWRVLRDQFDRDRALLGIIALALVPLYTFLALTLDANTVAMPFWAAALLFHLRARRGLGVLDAALAGGFASLALLGKFWAIYLMAGIAADAVFGRDTKRFWGSPAPYVMAATALAVAAPWAVQERGGTAFTFALDVMNEDSFGQALAGSVFYLAGALAYVVWPLLLLAPLRPSRAALAEIAWPNDPARAQALLLLAVPLVLPALVNLVIPHRLTPLWTIPNWTLLPFVLYGSPRLTVDVRTVARAGLAALAVALVALIAAPIVAFNKFQQPSERERTHYRQVAEAAERLAGGPVQAFWGSQRITMGLAFYLPQARPFVADPSSPEGRAEIAAKGLLIVCISEDAPCRAAEAALAGPASRTLEVTFTRGFLGFVRQPASYCITVLPPARLKVGRGFTPTGRPRSDQPVRAAPEPGICQSAPSAAG